MRLSILLAIIGAVLVALAIVLFFYTASSSGVLTFAADLATKLNESQPVALRPGAEINLTTTELAVLVVNATKPLLITPTNTTMYSGGLEVAVLAPNVTAHIINNYTDTITVKYASAPLPAANVASLLSYALAAFASGVLGSVLLIAAAALYALKR